MTEYGRGPGPEPWHPEDPQYGDQGWTGHETQQGQMPYVAGPPQYQQEPQPQQPYYAQQQGQYPQAQQPPYAQQPQQMPYPQHPQQHQQPQQHPQRETYGGQGQVWDTGQVHYAGVPQTADPYAGVDPYAQQQSSGYPGEAPDLYGTPEAFPPPRPPSMRHLQTEEPWQEEEDAAADSFLAGGGGGDNDDGDGDGDDGGRGGRRPGRSGGKPKKRSGMACLIAAVVIVAVVGGGGYYGYSYLKDKFAAAEDFAGEGTGAVSIDIPKGTGLGEMGRILKAHGVVKSADAFVAAAEAHPKGKGIQAGSYAMKEHMSGRAAVELMANGAGMNALDVIPGWRNVQVYEAIDQRLKLAPGTTKALAAKDGKSLGLPDWANSNKDVKDPLEGFLYPARYDLGKDATPQSLLKQMVAKANGAYGNEDLKAQATKLGLQNPYQLVTVASLVQAEGKYQHDFDKISRVVYNRLKPGNTETYGLLDFDSTINYIKGQSTLDVGSVNDLRKLDDPYNTYKIKGLPAGPIGNPGPDALKSALNPEPGPWYYFVSVNENRTLFAVTNDEHNRNREEYEKERGRQ
ncbi:endolytic transglycosylase MltG [Streptomyces sp. H34-S4]|uniref:endolytic transglycosylase MltG n=1 Tax=Streptomyces sp. H34-S4 TaxID=2996463 RepID=UPI00226FD768|nr:endolytic transglycosylase MltG [Streptomyces sp. H34-S4]MCY0938062.1 endolytic transglycosylase MltG [Streptomyces sp. H34-S4]